MQKISFGGKEYVRATEVAKKFRYTADYVGQLCRSGKVESRLVGRNWFVVMESVTEYRKTKHKTQKTNIKPKTKSSNTIRQRVRVKTPTRKVASVDRPKTVRLVKKASPRPTVGVEPTYTKDNSVLIPILTQSAKISATKTTPIKKRPVITVEARPSTTIEVTPDKRRVVKFKTQKLPEISLSGKLSVTDEIDDVGRVADSDDTTAKVSPGDTQSAPEKTSEKSSSTPADITVATVKTDVSSVNATDLGSDTTAAEILSAKRASLDNINFTPKQVGAIQRRRSVGLIRSVLVTSVLAGLCGGLVLGLVAEISVIDNQSDSSFRFNLSNL